MKQSYIILHDALNVYNPFTTPLRDGYVEYARRLTARVQTGRYHLRTASVFKSSHLPSPLRWSTVNAEIKGEPRAIKDPSNLSKPVVGQNIAVRVVPFYIWLIYLPSFYLPGSFNFVFPKFLQSSTVECVLSSEYFLVVVGIHFVSP